MSPGLQDSHPGWAGKGMETVRGRPADQDCKEIGKKKKKFNCVCVFFLFLNFHLQPVFPQRWKRSALICVNIRLWHELTWKSTVMVIFLSLISDERLDYHFYSSISLSVSDCSRRFVWTHRRAANRLKWTCRAKTATGGSIEVLMTLKINQTATGSDVRLYVLQFASSINPVLSFCDNRQVFNSKTSHQLM